jgi:site-specific recombinase XerD
MLTIIQLTLRRSDSKRKVSGRVHGSAERHHLMHPEALQAYLGHKNIQHTVRYTELAPTRFKDFWRD